MPQNVSENRGNSTYSLLLLYDEIVQLFIQLPALLLI